jgi:methyl-accepting chemotaxis protein
LARAKARDEAIEAFDGRVRGLLDDVVGTVEHVTEASGRLKGAAARTGERGNAVSEAASRTSGNVQTVATATEELSASTEEISQRVQESSLMSREAVETITETTNTVAALGETANRIGEVVLLIQAIASQTNLLALNATIESARAGEAGKGFAVVAHEVKALATQTSQATDEVQKRVAEIQTSTGSVTESIDRATKAIRQVDEVVTSIASAVEEQNAATKEIARNVQHVALANDLVTENMVDVASDARDTHLLAQDLGTGATSLHAKAGELNGETSRFLETIKAL